jgi:peptide/nickel transport system substrate-binding protein
MRRFALLSVAVSCLLLATTAAATRPRYGGTLHVSTPEAISSLDPLGNDSVWHRNLTALLFDTLVTLDDQGRIQPALATTWQVDPSNQRWTFTLRPQVQFHDRSPLTPDSVAASLRAANPSWKIYASADSVVIQVSSPSPALLAELAERRNAIARRNSASNINGTGPFKIDSWTPGKQLSVVANDDYWNGRPFVDGIQVSLGVSASDAERGLELSRIDVATLLPSQTHLSGANAYQVSTSPVCELIALVFAHEPQSPGEATVREALNLAIDRASIRNVLLEGSGEPTASLLPNWMTGYAFLFPSAFDLTAARERRASTSATARWSLGYDPSDPLARTLAERIALNAQDAGILLRASSAPSPDVRLVRILLASPDPHVALPDLAQQLGVPMPAQAMQSEQDLYQAESELLRKNVILPIVFLPVRYATNSSLQDWTPTRLGTWRPASLWLARPIP